MAPAWGNCSPVTSFIKVDLPQPDGPTTAANSPSAMESVSLSTAMTPPSPAVGVRDVVDLDEARHVTLVPRCVAREAPDERVASEHRDGIWVPGYFASAKFRDDTQFTLRSAGGGRNASVKMSSTFGFDLKLKVRPIWSMDLAKRAWSMPP